MSEEELADAEEARRILAERGFGRLAKISGEAAGRAMTAADAMAKRLPKPPPAAVEPAHVFRPIHVAEDE